VLITGLFEPVRAAADQRKAALGLVDYHEMLTRLADALNAEAPETEALLSSVRARYRCVLIDEFQDTDALQWQIFSSLFVESEQHRVIVVGDPKQAIYGFRGGDLPVYLAARQSLSGHPSIGSAQALEADSGEARSLADSRLIRLDTSYRSSQALLSVFSDLFGGEYFTEQGLQAAPLLAQPTPPRLLNTRGEALPALSLLAAPNDKRLWNRSKKETAQIIQRSVSAQIQRLVGERSEARFQQGDAEPRPLRHSDLMILCLTGRECEAMGEVLSSDGVPFTFFKRGGLGSSHEARQLTLLLEALCRPDDATARARLWLSDFFLLPLKDIEAVREGPASDPLLALPRRWATLAAHGHFESLFEAIFSESGLGRRLAQQNDERALTNYLQLTETLLRLARSEALGAADLLSRLRELARSDDSRGDENLRRLATEHDVVQVLTMHAAKGLEAPVVLLAFAPAAKSKHGLSFTPRFALPHFYQGLSRKRSISDDRSQSFSWFEVEGLVRDELEAERRRLFYVAATRAKVHLALPAFLPPPPESEDTSPLCFVPGYEAFNLGVCAAAANPAHREHLEVIELGNQAVAESSSAPDQTATDRAPAKPSRRSCPPLASPVLSRQGYADLLATRMAPLISSYSRIKRGRSDTLQEFAGLSLDDRIGELPSAEQLSLEAPVGDSSIEGLNQGPPLGTEASTDALAPAANSPAGLLDQALPPGRQSGLFLHALLENLDYEAVREAKGPAEWLESQALKDRLLRLASRYGLPPEAVNAGCQLAHEALRAPLILGQRSMSEGLVSSSHRRHELLFHLPLPELSHPLLMGQSGLRSVHASDPSDLPGNSGFDAANPLRPFASRRGYLTGSIDLVFEHDGLIYLLDWKSDRLPRYDPVSLAALVRERYSLQAKLYSFTLARQLELDTREKYEALFGGTLYLFLRAFDSSSIQAPPSDETALCWGLHFERMSFDEMGGFERELLLKRDLGGPSLAPSARLDRQAPATSRDGSA